ncbi:MAG: YqgE/AlgH family protein [Beijerinckiaceae bacterium]
MPMPTRRKSDDRGYLDGQFLIAMPGMIDDRFAKAVIYMCAHTSEGSMGLIVNHRAPKVQLPDLLVQLDIVPDASAIRLNARNQRINVLRGGPVDTGRGFVLHSSDFYAETSTMPVAEGLCLTTTVDILRAIARGEGPERALLALGYAGWSPGQLESEIQQNAWLSCEADPDLIFDDGVETKYERILRKLGIDPMLLSSTAGHA